MAHHNNPNLKGKTLGRLHHINSVARAKSTVRSAPLSKRARGERNVRLPFVPPEDWHEPREGKTGYRIVVQPPGEGFRHILTPAEVRERLSQVPAEFLDSLDVVQFSRMTRKKQSFPCYGMQWGTSLYLYPIENNLVEYYSAPPKPNQINEARMYGGRWVAGRAGEWKLIWTEAAIKDFYLNNILMHELGHLIDDRNARSADRERYAEWFAVRYGFQASRRLDPDAVQPYARRHSRPSA